MAATSLIQGASTKPAGQTTLTSFWSRTDVKITTVVLAVIAATAILATLEVKYGLLKSALAIVSAHPATAIVIGIIGLGLLIYLTIRVCRAQKPQDAKNQKDGSSNSIQMQPVASSSDDAASSTSVPPDANSIPDGTAKGSSESRSIASRSDTTIEGNAPNPNGIDGEAAAAASHGSSQPLDASSSAVSGTANSSLAPAAATQVVEVEQEQINEVDRDVEEALQAIKAFNGKYQSQNTEQGFNNSKHTGYITELERVNQTLVKLCPKDNAKLQKLFDAVTRKDQYIALHKAYRELLNLKIKDLEWLMANDKGGTIYKIGSGFDCLANKASPGTEVSKRTRLHQWRKEALTAAEANYNNILASHDTK